MARKSKTKTTPPPSAPVPYHAIHPSLVGRNHPIHIDLVGAGGTGSQVLTGLARMHSALRAVGHVGLDVHLSDPDTVSPANIGRQLFSPADVGQNKAQVLIHRINCFFGLSWSAIPVAYKATIANPTILISCVDTIAARRSLSHTYARYWLDLGNSNRTGQVILGQSTRSREVAGTKRLPTVLEVFPELNRGRIKEHNEPSCSLAGALEKQDLFINQAVATWALHLLWTLLRRGRIETRGYFINLDTGRTVPIPVT